MDGDTVFALGTGRVDADVNQIQLCAAAAEVMAPRRGQRGRHGAGRMRGLGVDLCQVGRIERALQGGDAFLQRFFTAGERDYLASRGQMRAQSAAAMFAAKEAFLKAVARASEAASRWTKSR